MKAFFDAQRGARMLVIIDLGPNRQPTHFYQGGLVATGETFIVLKDDQLGDIAVALDKIVSVKVLTEAQAGLDVIGANLEGYER
jgi:hypothetical protein